MKKLTYENQVQHTLKEKRVTQSQLAKFIGISPKQLSFKLNRKAPWRVDEYAKIYEMIGVEKNV